MLFESEFEALCCSFPAPSGSQIVRCLPVVTSGSQATPKKKTFSQSANELNRAGATEEGGRGRLQQAHLVWPWQDGKWELA